MGKKLFRQKDFTIAEGHYTGPKDEVPGYMEAISKGALVGSGIGGILGAVVPIAKDPRHKADVEVGEVIDSALTGGTYGAIGGVLLKFFLNYLHNPMSSIKYSEVDRGIRQKFGVYRMSGVTVGDSVDKRASIDEKFSFNDREVTNYKINISVQDNKVTLYTFGMTRKELDKTDKVLDYYCKKYHGMDYSSKLINQTMNSYAVDIKFTNYQVISNFIMELSTELETKINLLDNKAVVDNKLTAGGFQGGDQKNFSVATISKEDALDIVSKTGSAPFSAFKVTRDWKTTLSYTMIQLLKNTLEKINNDEETIAGKPVARKLFNNIYLEDVLKKNHFIEGFNYTVGESKSTNNISLVQGKFIVTTEKNSKEQKDIEKEFYKSAQTKINRSDAGKVIIYTYNIQSRQEFDFLIKKLFNTRIIFNIYE
jgi:hypothetical protein